MMRNAKRDRQGVDRKLKARSTRLLVSCAPLVKGGHGHHQLDNDVYQELPYWHEGSPPQSDDDQAPKRQGRQLRQDAVTERNGEPEWPRWERNARTSTVRGAPRKDVGLGPLNARDYMSEAVFNTVYGDSASVHPAICSVTVRVINLPSQGGHEVFPLVAVHDVDSDKLLDQTEWLLQCGVNPVFERYLRVPLKERTVERNGRRVQTGEMDFEHSLRFTLYSHPPKRNQLARELGACSLSVGEMLQAADTTKYTPLRCSSDPALDAQLRAAGTLLGFRCAPHDPTQALRERVESAAFAWQEETGGEFVLVFKSDTSENIEEAALSEASGLLTSVCPAGEKPTAAYQASLASLSGDASLLAGADLQPRHSLHEEQRTADAQLEYLRQVQGSGVLDATGGGGDGPFISEPHTIAKSPRHQKDGTAQDHADLWNA